MSEVQQFYQAIEELFAVLVIAEHGTKFLATLEARQYFSVKLKQDWQWKM